MLPSSDGSGPIAVQHEAGRFAGLVRALANNIRAPWALVDALMPYACALCDLPLDGPEAATGFCHACLAALPGACRRRCRHCGLHAESGICGACQSAQPTGLCRVCCDYDAPVDQLIAAFKYGGQPGLARAIGSVMAACLAGPDQADSSGSLPLLIPVPAARERLARRGYNQAALLARVIARRRHLPVAWSCLRRRRETLPQSGLGRAARWRNLEQVMDASAAATQRDIILVDDVITTGATMAEAERALRVAGATSVLRLAFARTPAPDRLSLPDV